MLLKVIPINPQNIDREQYKSWYWEIALSIYFVGLYVRRRVDVHITTINQFHPAGWPGKLLLQLLSLMCRVEEKYLVHFSKTALLLWYTVLHCSCKYLKIQHSSFLKFQYQATRNFFLWVPDTVYVWSKK